MNERGFYFLLPTQAKQSPIELENNKATSG